MCLLKKVPRMSTQGILQSLEEEAQGVVGIEVADGTWIQRDFGINSLADS